MCDVISNMFVKWSCYLCEQVEAAQSADDTVDLRKPLPFPTGLQDIVHG